MSEDNQTLLIFEAWHGLVIVRHKSYIPYLTLLHAQNLCGNFGQPLFCSNWPLKNLAKFLDR